MNTVIVLQIRDEQSNHICSSFRFESMSGQEQPTLDAVNTVLPLLLNKHFLLVENNEVAGLHLNHAAIQRKEKEIKCTLPQAVKPSPNPQ